MSLRRSERTAGHRRVPAHGRLRSCASAAFPEAGGRAGRAGHPPPRLRGDDPASRPTSTRAITRTATGGRHHRQLLLLSAAGIGYHDDASWRLRFVVDATDILDILDAPLEEHVAERAELKSRGKDHRAPDPGRDRGRAGHRHPQAAGRDRLRHARPRHTSTPAPTTSAITFIDGEKGILRYRGIPIEELAEQSSVRRGGLPAHLRRAAHQGRARRVLDAAHPPHADPRGHEALLRRLPGDARTRWPSCRRWSPRCPASTRRPRRERTASSSTSPSPGCWPSCRPSPPSRTRSRSASRSSTRKNQLDATAPTSCT